MLEPGPFTTLLGGAELLGGGQLQDPRPDQGGKSAVSAPRAAMIHIIAVVMLDVSLMTPLPGDVRNVRLERPLPRRGVRGEALGQPHASLLQLHSQQVGTYKYYKKYIIKMDQLCQPS